MDQPTDIRTIADGDPDHAWVSRALDSIRMRGVASYAAGAINGGVLVEYEDGRTVVVLGGVMTSAHDQQLWQRFGLTPRETQVAELLLRRSTNKEIAKELGISPHTAWRHTERVLDKTGSRGRRGINHVIPAPR